MFTLPSKVAEYDVDYMHGRLNFKPESNKLRFLVPHQQTGNGIDAQLHIICELFQLIGCVTIWVKREDITGSSQKGAIVLHCGF